MIILVILTLKMWKQCHSVDLPLFEAAIADKRKQGILIEAMFPEMARRKGLENVIAGEVNVYVKNADDIDSKVLKERYQEVWKEGRVPVVLSRTRGATFASVAETGDYDWQIYATDVDFRDWVDTIFFNISDENREKFRDVIKKSFVGFLHSANQGVAKIIDIRTRYMRLLDMIASVAKMGPIEECQLLGKHCWQLDTLQQEQSESLEWMPEEIRLSSRKQHDDNRKAFAQLLKQCLKDSKLDCFKNTLVHLASLLYVFNQYQAPLVDSEEEAVQQRLEDQNHFKQMVLEIQGELDDEE